LDTSKRFVEQAPAGYSASELDNALHVQTRQIGGAFIYFALEWAQRQRQRRA
jgi:hypothetical protein